MYQFYVYLVILGASLHPACCINDDHITKIDAFIKNIMQCRNGVGMTLAIVHNNDTYTNAYGVKNLETGEPVTTKSLFDIASVSKHFAATLLGSILEDHQGVDWDSPARDVLGEEFYFHDGLRTNRTTLRDLSAHNTGVPRHDFLYWSENTRDILPERIRFLEPVETFRQSFVYNNLMHTLVGIASEKLAGQTLEELLQKRLFGPAGMVSSTMVSDPKLHSLDMQTPYIQDGDNIREVSRDILRIFKAGGAAGILTNAEDMTNWIQVHLNKGTSVNGDHVVGGSVLEEIYTGIKVTPENPYFKRPFIPATYEIEKYGLGMFRGSYRGLRMYSHGGSTYGHNTNFVILPDMNIGIFSSISPGLSSPASIIPMLTNIYIMDILMEEEPWLNHTNACTFPLSKCVNSDTELFNIKYDLKHNLVQSSLREIFPPDVNWTQCMSGNNMPLMGKALQDYTGVYGHFAYGNMTVEETDQGVLVLSYVDPAVFILKDCGSDVFYGQGYGEFWPMDSIVYFKHKLNSVGEPFDEMLFYASGLSYPVFVRDLMMSEAYPPPDTNDCGKFE